MTDRPPDRPLDDDLPEVDDAFELASARHDGEGTDVDRTRADDGVLADARAVAAIARQVSEVPPPPAGLLDDHVGAALAVFDEEHEASASAAAAGARVTSLAERRPWWQRAPLGAVAAAVAVVALVGAIGFAAVGSGDDDSADTATAALDSADDDAAGGEAGADALESEEGAAAGGTSITGDEREAFASYDELAAVLGDRPTERAPADATTEEDGTDDAIADAPVPEASRPPEATTESAGAAGCDALGVAGIDPTTVELVVPVVVDGQLVTAVVHGGDDGRRLTSIDEATCTVTDERAL